MSDIRTTVIEALRKDGRSNYAGYAETVIADLEQREAEITADLIDVATDKGLDKDEAIEIFEGVGLHLPVEDEPEAVEETTIGTVIDESIAAVLTSVNTLATSVERLATFARQHGFRG